ncbi:uncharacterized protein LOC144440886 isoform X1 [Glandiceps talaboti]
MGRLALVIVVALVVVVVVSAQNKPHGGQPKKPPKTKKSVVAKAMLVKKVAAKRQGGGGASCDDTCQYANDGMCDVPDYCLPGTDCSDCPPFMCADGSTSIPGHYECDGDNDCGDDSDEVNCENSCNYAYDGVCDEPMYCEYGTDTDDCSGPPFMCADGSNIPGHYECDGDDDCGDDSDEVNCENSCQYAYDGMCDEPTYCGYGTDTDDCSGPPFICADGSNIPGHYECDGDDDCGDDSDEVNCENSCNYANDGMCDEPMYCEYGTDSDDCSGGADCDSCIWNNDGMCDVPAGFCEPGTDCSDCEHSCPWTNDGECDEPYLCEHGTDSNDCQEHSCPWTNDGECDEPYLCEHGTDSNDCQGHHYRNLAAKSASSKAEKTAAKAHIKSKKMLDKTAAKAHIKSKKMLAVLAKKKQP